MCKINKKYQMKKTKPKCSNNKVSPFEETEFKLPISPVIGIDFGTTNSCVGVWESGRVKIIDNKLGNPTTPSCVAFTKLGRLVGDAATNQIVENPANTICDVKRLIGRRLNDTMLQDDLELWPFEVVVGSAVPADATKPKVVVTHQSEDEQFTAEEITAMVLMKMKENAEAYVGSTVKSAVLTVPAYFNETQRQAIEYAGVSAGFGVIHFISEPHAVATAYSLHKKCYSRGTLSENVMIFDLGGGTLDVSLIRMEDYHSEVEAVSSDTRLGGRDFDNRLVNHFVEEIRNKFGKDISSNPKSLAKLRTSCERAKKILSSATETIVEIELFGDGIAFSSTLTRKLFEELNSDLFKRCMDCIEKCLEDGKMNKNDVHSFALVGGSTKIPKIHEMLKEYFKGKEICQGINPDTAVATGAAIVSAVMTAGGDDIKCLFGKNATPSSLGLKLIGGGMSIVVPKKSTPALKKMGEYTTPFDNTTAVSIEVYEGESKRVKKNKYLDKMILSKIPPAPKGVPKIDVYFEITVDGVLTVTAELRGTSNKMQMTIAKPILAKSEKKQRVKGPVSKMLKKIQKCLLKVF